MKIAKALATWIPALLIALPGVMKLTGSAQVAETMRRLGVEGVTPLLGVMELTFAALYVVPATFKIGFLLASCHLAGAIATELSHGALTMNPFVPITLLWIGRLHPRPPDLLLIRPCT